MSELVARRAPCYALAAIASVPVWITGYLPLQDLPLHVATIRILASFHDPAFRFGDNFVLRLGRTQYLLYDLVGAALARVSTPLFANAVLMSVYLTGTVLALEWLLGELGQDRRLCLFVVPLLVNVPFMLGLLPFLLGVPLLLAGVALSLRYLRALTPGRGALVTAAAAALFYSHVVPFLLFAVTYAALFPWTKPRSWARAAAPWIPVVPVVVWWATSTVAGRVTSGVLFDVGGSRHKPILQSLADFYQQVGAVFADRSDQWIFVALLAVALGSVVVTAIRGESFPRLARGYWVLPATCVACYLALAEGHDYVFFIAQRFAVLFAVTAIPLLPMPSGSRGTIVTIAAAVVALVSIANTAREFRRFDREEVGAFDAAIAVMPPRSRVCALIYDSGSRIVRNAPFLHFGSYYQASRGGLVMFTYAGYPHWPVDFAPDRYPPPGGPARQRWEWTPRQVPMAEIYPFYDYVLTRGRGFEPEPGTYREAWRDGKWAVWARD